MRQVIFDVRRHRQPFRQLSPMQRYQEIDRGFVALRDRRRRIAGNDALVAEILHDQESVIEIGLQDGRRREVAIAQALRQRDIRNDVLGEMRDGAIGLAVAHRRTVGTARRIHQHVGVIVEDEALEDARRSVAFHAAARHVAISGLIEEAAHLRDARHPLADTRRNRRRARCGLRN